MMNIFHVKIFLAGFLILFSLTAFSQTNQESNQDKKVFQYDSIIYNVTIGNYNNYVPDSILSYLDTNYKEYRIYCVKNTNNSYAVKIHIRCYNNAVIVLQNVLHDGYKDAVITSCLCMDKIDIEEAKKLQSEKCK